VSTKPIAILGAGGFAREVLQVVLDINDQYPDSPPWSPVGFIVEDNYAEDSVLHDLPVLEGLHHLADRPEIQLHIAVGNSAARYRLAARITENYENEFATLIHPKAWVGRNVVVGPGTVICAGAQVTTDISIKSHVHINIGSTIGHDATLQDFVTLNPGVNISGGVEIGTGTEIGTNTVVIPDTRVGEWSVIGAGSVVTKPLPENITAVGGPAKVIKSREPDWCKEN